MFTTICVGYDGSESSDNAVRAACDLCAKYGAALHIVHTPHLESLEFVMGAVTGYHVATSMPSPQDTAKAAELMLERAAKTAAAAGQTEFVSHVGQGEAARALIDYANDAGVDLIVTGRRGLGNLTALVLGSTSQTVAHLASCAHLTVK